MAARAAVQIARDYGSADSVSKVCRKCVQRDLVRFVRRDSPGLIRWFVPMARLALGMPPGIKSGTLVAAY